jgi:hypothetical protein
MGGIHSCKRGEGVVVLPSTFLLDEKENVEPEAETGEDVVVDAQEGDLGLDDGAEAAKDIVDGVGDGIVSTCPCADSPSAPGPSDANSAACCAALESPQCRLRACEESRGAEGELVIRRMCDASEGARTMEEYPPGMAASCVGSNR